MQNIFRIFEGTGPTREKFPDLHRWRVFVRISFPTRQVLDISLGMALRNRNICYYRVYRLDSKWTEVEFWKRPDFLCLDSRKTADDLFRGTLYQGHRFGWFFQGMVSDTVGTGMPKFIECPRRQKKTVSTALFPNPYGQFGGGNLNCSPRIYIFTPLKNIALESSGAGLQTLKLFLIWTGFAPDDLFQNPDLTTGKKYKVT